MLDDTEVDPSLHTITAGAQPAQSSDPAESAAVSGDEPARTQHSILRHIFEHSAPAELPSLWSCFPATKRVRTLSCEPPELVASLQNSFPAEALLAARVLVPGPDQELQLTPVLHGSSKFRVLRDNNGLVDLVSDAGALVSDNPPCSAYAGPRTPSDPQPKRIFVCSMDDLQVLYCLGLRCTSAAGLASLVGQQVRRLYANLSPSSPPRCRLTLVGWSLADLERKMPAYVASILKRLRDANRLYQTEQTGVLFDLWEPSKSDCELIRTAIAFGDRERVCHAVLASAHSGAKSVVSYWNKRRESADTDLLSRHADLVHAIGVRDMFDSGMSLETATARYRETLHRLTTQRLLQAAAKAATPLESFAFLMRAEIVGHLNQNCGLLRAAQPRHGFSFHYDPALSVEQLDDLVLGANVMLKLERLSPIVI